MKDMMIWYDDNDANAENWLNYQEKNIIFLIVTNSVEPISKVLGQFCIYIYSLGREHCVKLST